MSLTTIQSLFSQCSVEFTPDNPTLVSYGRRGLKGGVHVIQLGSKVVDTITGFEGIAVARCEYIAGYTEYGVRPRAKDGIRPDVCYIEENALVVKEDEK